MQGSGKTVKSFLLTSPELLSLEMSNCEEQGMLPDRLIETKVEINGKPVNSALIYQYRKSAEDDGGYYESL